MNKLFISLLSLLFVGCASQSDLDALRNDLSETHLLATNAQQTALNAAQCCITNRQSLDKMYNRLMAK